MSAVLVAGSLVMALAIDDRDTSIGTGVGITGLVAITAPIVAFGGGSARDHPDVGGSVGLRIISWISYVAFLIDAAVLLSAAADGAEIPDSVAISAVVLGIAVEISFAVDAFTSAAQAESVARRSPPGTRVQPYVGLVPQAPGAWAPVVGLSGSF